MFVACLLISGCGSGGGGSLNTQASSVASGSTPLGPTINLKLTDAAAPFAARTSISSTNPGLLTATVTDGGGAAVPNAIVTFSADPLFGAFAGGANTALTNSSGVATITLTTPNTSGGASTVSANATVGANAITSSLSYSIGSVTLGLSAVTFPGLPAAGLSAYGTVGVSVDVLSNNAKISAPMTVSFSSACTSSGKATLTPSVTTKDGTAQASYLDNGCGNTDTITATLAGGPTASGSLKVNSPDAGSIQFVSVAPSIISLKGTGGAGRSEAATVTFRVLDKTGKPVGGAPVTFGLSTRIGGLNLVSDGQPPVISDPATGNVVTAVQSGLISTSVRVTATTGILSTLSDQLIVSTGIAAQDSFSLSASAHNIEGWNIDGTTSALTIRAADHFRNPVPDGTAISFTAEGGAIEPGCTTVAGACTAVLTSQALRPNNGRVTVLARAIGEEAFTDLNSDGVVNTLTEMVDANGASTDMGDAFVDYNENGVRDSNEPYFDFNGNGYYTAPKNAVSGDVAHRSNGLYRGLLCNGDPAVCSAQKTIDVRGSQVIVFSSSSAIITINNGATIALPPCTVGGGPGASKTFSVNVVDLNGNAMPVGTAVAFSSDNGTITSDTGYVVPDTTACNSAYAGCPATAGSAAFGNILVTMKSDSTLVTDATTGVVSCSDPNNSSGAFKVTVTAPSGKVTTATIGVTD